MMLWQSMHLFWLLHIMVWALPQPGMCMESIVYHHLAAGLCT